MMQRAFFLIPLTLMLAAMGKPSPPPPMPAACDVLQTIDLAATLGPATTYVPGHASQVDTVRLSMCSAEIPDFSAGLTLLLRESQAGEGPDAQTLRDAMTDQLRSTVGADVVIEPVAIGDAAIWVGAIGQLTVWHRAGSVMLILSPTPQQDRAAAENAARKILAAFP